MALPLIRMTACLLLFLILCTSVLPHELDVLHGYEKLGLNADRRLNLERFVANVSRIYRSKWYRDNQTLIQMRLDAGTKQCFYDYFRITEAVLSGETWPFQFIDASAKIPSGLTGGAITWPGSYELCKHIHSRPSPNDTEIRGRYCAVRFPITIHDPDVAVDIGITIGLCLPSDCNTDELRSLVKTMFALPHLQTDDRYTYCHSDWDEMASDKFFIAAVTLIAIIGTMVLVGSVIDMVLYMKWKDSPPYQPMDPFETMALNTESSSYLASTSSTQSEEPIISAPHRQQTLNFQAYADYRMDFYRKYTCCGAWLLVFSFPYNMYKLWHTRSPEIKDENGHWQTHPLAGLEGMRVITLGWIIYVHTFTFQAYYMNNALLYQEEAYEDWKFQLTRNGSFSVDTFFLISGLLACYILIPTSQKCKGFCAKVCFWLHYAVHRFLRIAPSWFFVTILFTGLFPYLTDGPFYPQHPVVQEDLAACRDHWYATFLNNWIFADKPCMLWTWYLSNDYQFSVVLTPVFATLMAIHWLLGIVFAVALVISSSVATFVITYRYQYGPAPVPLISMAHLYSAVYTRWGSYAIGMILGWLLQARPIKGTNRPWWFRLLVTLSASAVAAFLTLITLFGLHKRLHNPDNEMSDMLASVYAALSRPAWSIGIAICIYLCAAEWSPIVNSVLSFSGFRVLARLTYCAYLIHPIIAIYYEFSRTQPVDIDNTYLMFCFLAIWTLSYFMAILISMCTEVPVIAMESVMRKIPGNREGASSK